MIYKSTAGRYLVTHMPMAHAMKDGIVQSEKISARDFPAIIDAPTLDMAICVLAAMKIQPSMNRSYRNHKKDVSGALARLAKENATMHQKCLSLQTANAPLTLGEYSHIYSTNHNRYAISQTNLYPASDMHNPDEIIEEAIRLKDMAKTCFVPSFSLATFLMKATCGAFHNTSSTLYPYHNTIQIDQNSSSCVIRTAKDIYLPVQQVIAEGSDIEQRMYLYAAEMQNALCCLYLALVQPALNHL